MQAKPFDVERAVRTRYSAAAQQKVEALCCPIDYDTKYLRVIPQEILERDYGCGDPSKHLRRGETVLDLGSGAGKICFIASQVVGPEGRVIGIDMNDDMLALARKHQRAVGDVIGWHNVEFRKGRIQDLALDLERLDSESKATDTGAPHSGAAGYNATNEPGRNPALHKLEAIAEQLRTRHPLVATESIDAVVSNCVLNLVDPPAKRQLFAEIFRVLRRSGRAVISDIVSSAPVPAELQSNPELWSGCIAGAFTQDGFLRAFGDAGFQTIRVLKLDATPWRTLHGIDFRSITVEALKSGQATQASDNAASASPGKCCCDGPPR